MGYKAGVITVSDSCYAKTAVDSSGPTIIEMLRNAGWDVVFFDTIPDEIDQIEKALIGCADNLRLQLVVTTGGTGFAKRDVTPEATKEVIERETPGIPEAMRAESLKITPKGCLSREAAGIRGETLIVNCPGSVKACRETLGAVLPALEHGVKMMLSEGSANCGR